MGPHTEKLDGTQGAWPPPSFPGGALRAGGSSDPACRRAWAGDGRASSFRGGAGDTRGRDSHIRLLARGIRNWVARTAVSELWKVRHGPGLAGVPC